MRFHRLGPFVAALALGAVAGAAQAAVAQRQASCSWDSPGHNPFMGDVVAAVDHYADIPADVRQRLKQRMAERRYDDLVTIRRDSIDGRERYGATIRDMHFGEASVCAQTTRSGWSASMRERGLVYCESGHCILVPTVCRNVSRIDRLPPERVAEPKAPAEAAPGELLFEPPAAGAEPPESFAKLSDPPETGLGEGMTPLAGPGSSSSWPSGQEPPSWIGTGGPRPDSPWYPGGAPTPIVIGPLVPPLLQPPVEPPPGVTPVPEPQTWALMVGGLALVLAAVRRRRQG